MPAATSAQSSADAIVEFFDRRAAEYDREYLDETPAGYALRIRRTKVLDLFDRPGGAVLDVGCGPGVMTAALLDRGCSFCGVDPSEKMIEIGRRRFPGEPRARFLQGDAGKLEFDDAAFDVVLCMGVMDSVADGPRAVREMMRVLKPGGELIVTFTNLHSPYSWWKNYAFYPAVAAWHRLRLGLGDPSLNPGRIRSGRLRTLYSRPEAEALVTSVGGVVVDVVPYYYNLFLSPLDEIVPRLALRVTRRLEESVAAATRPGWMAGGWILKARKR